MNNDTKLLVDLTNVDEVIKDKDKVLILLSSLSDEGYETIIQTLIMVKLHLATMMCQLLLQITM